MLVFSLQLLAFNEVLLKIAEFLFPRNKPKNSDIGIFGVIPRKKKFRKFQKHLIKSKQLQRDYEHHLL